jgi:hypothetical protein
MSTATDEHYSRGFEETRRRVWWVGALIWVAGLAAVVAGLLLATPG